MRLSLENCLDVCLQMKAESPTDVIAQYVTKLQSTQKVQSIFQMIFFGEEVVGYTSQQNCNLRYFFQNYLVYAVIYLCSCLHVFIYAHIDNTSLVPHFIFFPVHLEIPFTLDGSSKVKSRMEAMVDSLVKHLLGQNSSLVI